MRSFTPEEVASMLQRFNGGEPAYKIALTYKVAHARVCRILRAQGADLKRNERSYCPSEAEIEQAKAAIRARNIAAVPMYCPPIDEDELDGC